MTLRRKLDKPMTYRHSASKSVDVDTASVRTDPLNGIFSEERTHDMKFSCPDQVFIGKSRQHQQGKKGLGRGQ